MSIDLLAEVIAMFTAAVSSFAHDHCSLREVENTWLGCEAGHAQGITRSGGVPVFAVILETVYVHGKWCTQPIEVTT